MLGIQTREEVFHLLEARDVRCIFFLRRARRNHIQETVAGFGDVAGRMSERFCLGNFLALHIVEGEYLLSCEQRLSQHGGEVFFRLRIAPLGHLSVFLIAVIEDRLHEDAVERSDETCDVFLGIVLRHFQKPHGAVADEQEPRFTAARIKSEFFREIDHCCLRHDGSMRRSILRHIIDETLGMLQPEKSRRSQEKRGNAFFYFPHTSSFTMPEVRMTADTRAQCPSRCSPRRPRRFSHSARPGA